MTDPLPQIVDVAADDALGSDDAVGLLERLARREVSGAELRDAAVERALRADASLAAVACWVHGAESDPQGAFAGIPSLIKDNEELAGYPGGQGSWAVADHPAAASTPWVEQFLALGFAPIAKTTLPEFGLTASTESSRYGATRNPWGTGRSAGGSSGGTAALVAAGVVPMAHGNDGGGSIRIPSACCGLVGLKPTRGRLPNAPEREEMPVPITTQGVLSRTVRDTARYYAEVERLAPHPSLPPVGDVRGPGERRLRVGVLLTGSRGLPVADDVLRSVRATAEVLEGLGHHVDEVPVPVDDGFGPDFLRYWALLSWLLRYQGGKLYGPGFDGKRTERLTQGLARLAGDNLVRLPGAVRRLRRLAFGPEDWAAGHDVLLTPVLSHEPPEIGYFGPDVDPRTHIVRLLGYSSFTPVQNVTGGPAISLPVGTSDHGLPLGVQVVAPRGGERTLLEVAYELEAAMPWPTSPGAGRDALRR